MEVSGHLQASEVLAHGNILIPIGLIEVVHQKIYEKLRLVWKKNRILPLSMSRKSSGVEETPQSKFRLDEFRVRLLF
jgi:hypothetical protein